MLFSSTNYNSSKNVDHEDHPFCYNFPEDDPDHSFDHDLPICFFPFDPSPFDVVDEYEYQQQQPQNLRNMDEMLDMPKKEKNGIRKRMSKKERHSKIKTARGVRDRRMRLSVPVAQQFFGLQDMLGFDKPSKTVEWLLIQANPQISKLYSTKHIIINNNNHDRDDQMMINFVEKIKSLNSDDHGKKNKKKKKKRVVINLKQQQPIKKSIIMAKEMRELARARARARTMEKKLINQDFDDNNFNNKIISISSSNLSGSPPFENVEEFGAINLNPSIQVLQKPITSQSQPIIDYQLQNFEIMAEWSPSYSTFNYHHQTDDQNLHLQQNEFEDSDIFG